MQIPDYKAKTLYARLKRIVECAKCDPRDTKTANALRLLKGDLRTLEKLLKDGNKEMQQMRTRADRG